MCEVSAKLPSHYLDVTKAISLLSLEKLNTFQGPFDFFDDCYKR